MAEIKVSMPAPVPALRPAPPFLPALVPAPPPAPFWNSRFDQEPRNFKRGFRQRGFLQIRVSRPRKQKVSKDIGPSSTFGTQSAAAKRGVHFSKAPPSKNPLFLAPDLGVLYQVARISIVDQAKTFQNKKFL